MGRLMYFDSYIWRTVEYTTVKPDLVCSRNTALSNVCAGVLSTSDVVCPTLAAWPPYHCQTMAQSESDLQAPKNAESLHVQRVVYCWMFTFSPSIISKFASLHGPVNHIFYLCQCRVWLSCGALLVSGGSVQEAGTVITF